MRSGWPFIAVFAVLIWLMLEERREAMAPFWATLVLLSINQLMRGHRMKMAGAIEFIVATGRGLAELVAILTGIGFIIGAPTFVLFGWLSDKVGRKWIMMAGLFIGAMGYHAMFNVLLNAGNPALAQAMQTTPVRVHADTTGGACDFGLQAAMIGSHADHKKVCVQAKKFLVGKGINFEYAAPIAGQEIAMSVGGVTVNGFDRGRLSGKGRSRAHRPRHHHPHPGADDRRRRHGLWPGRVLSG